MALRSDRSATTMTTQTEGMPLDGSDSGAGTESGRHDIRQHLYRLAQVAQATSTALILTDVDGVIVWVNAGFTRMTGYTLEDAVGRTPGRLLQGPDTDRAEAARIGMALRSRRGIAAELVNYTKDGRRYWVGLKIEPLVARSGEIDGFLASEADITERYERRRELEQLTRRFDMATQGGRIGLYERRMQGDDDWWWNDVMWELVGQDRRTFTPSYDSWMALVHPDDREMVRNNAGSPGLPRTAARLQYRIVRPDGQIRHMASIASQSTDSGDATARITGVLIDVTARVESEEREHLLQQQLRESSHQAGMAEIVIGVLHNVGNVLNSLGVANDMARRNLRALRVERLEQAAHLIRSNRDGLAAFLRDDEQGRHLPDYLAALSAQMSTSMKAVQAELDTIEHLMDHLRDIVSAQQSLAHVGGLQEPTDLRELAESALTMQSTNLAEVELVRQFGDLPLVTTDRHKLLQILVNLLRNAGDAVRASATRPGRIVVRITRDGCDAVVVVEDSGVGMSQDVLQKLWRFGFTTKQDGHGFGLHNSANAAHEIGATLTAHSDGPGHGSRFTLRVPVSRPATMLSGAAA